MASTAIPTTKIITPGAISVANGATRALVSQLQLLTPQYYKTYVEKYGDEDFTMWLATFGGMEEVKNQTYEWFENRGKLMQAVSTAAAVTAPAAGATVTITLAAADHYNGGTQSAIRVGETVRVASNNIEGVVLTVDKSVNSAHTATIRPKKSTQAFVSAGSANLLAGEVLIFGGHADVGEASNSIDPLVHLDSRFTNTITEIRESWSATDLAEMAEVAYNSGVSGEAPIGQAGTSYFTLKGLKKANTSFKNNIEFKLMRGDVQNNSGLSGSAGSQGILPKLLADASIATYTTASGITKAKLHEITRIMDVNGCAKEALWMQDIFQRQQFDDGLFTEFAAGAYLWGSNEKSEEAAVAFGVRSVLIDGYLLKVKKYKAFNTEVTTGKSPVTDYFRDFGVIMPQGEAPDARNAAKSYKNISILCQQPPAGGTIGNGIRVWRHGGGSVAATNGQMVDKVEMITYRGSRVVAPSQFLVVQGS
jgi:hypothetical protein